MSSGDAEDRSGYGGPASRCVDGPGARTISAGRERAQGEANVAAVGNLDFTSEELAEIDTYAVESGINIWQQSSDA